MLKRLNVTFFAIFLKGYKTGLRISSFLKIMVEFCSLILYFKGTETVSVFRCYGPDSKDEHGLKFQKS